MTETTTALDRLTVPHRNPPSIWGLALRRFLRHRAGVIASTVFLLIVLIVAVGPLTFISYDAAFRPNPLLVNSAPSSEHLLGTDEVGRDILARLIYGGRISLTVGVLAMVVALSVGTVLGATAGYFGGLVDSIIMRFTDIMLSIPGIFLIIALSVFFGPSVSTIVLAIGLLNWMTVARIVRSMFLQLKEQEFVTAARCVGARNGRIMWTHILPNAIAPLAVAATLSIGSAILTETAVSYLGLGIQPPLPSWGNMLKNAQDVIWSAPWVATFPGLMIFFTTLCINFMGDALRDALDPRMKL
ncbi:MAG: ABC transporter permease [Anaerolineae bacterium]|jgi:peptide/nickel transport system permease protein